MIETIYAVAQEIKKVAPEKYDELIDAVSVHFKEVNEGIDKAEDMMEEVLLDRTQEDTFYIPISKYLA